MYRLWRFTCSNRGYTIRDAEKGDGVPYELQVKETIFPNYGEEEKHEKVQEGDLWYSCKLQELLQMKAYNTP